MTVRQRGWLLPPAALAMLAGVWLGRAADRLLFGLLACGLALLAVGLLRGLGRFCACVALALSLGVCAGWAAFHPVLPQEGDYSVQAIVSDEIGEGRFGQVRVCLTDVRLDDRPLSGGAYWTFYPDEIPPELAPGMEVSFSASLYHPSGADNPAGYDFRENLLRRGIVVGLYGAEELTVHAPTFFSPGGGIASLRHRLSQKLISALGEESGRYASALLLGMSSLIPSEDREAFSNLGIAHILSVSGFHAGILVGLLNLLFRLLRLPPKARLAGCGIVLLAYALLCGMNPPVVRAALFVLLAMEGRILNRPRSGLHLLSAAMMVAVLLSPAQVTGASFQLSYCAMFALLWFSPLADRAGRHIRNRVLSRLVHAVILTFGVQLGLLLPELAHFQRLPALSFLINLLAMPLAAVWIGCNWLALVLLPIPALSGLLSGMLSPATGGLLSAIRALGAVPGLTLWIHAPTVLTAVGMLFLLAGLCGLVRMKALPRLALGMTGALAVTLSLLALPHTATEYIQLSAGNADAAVLWDRDKVIVMDTGEDDAVLSSFLRYHRLTPDAVLLTHLHTDHAGGLQSLTEDQIPIRLLLLPEGAMDQQVNPDILMLLNQLQAAGTEIRALARGDVLPLPSGSLTVLWPERDRVRPGQDANSYSLVSRLLLRGSSLLQTGDLAGAYEAYAAAPSDLLKAAHHGSPTSTTPAFLAAVSPQAALLSCRRLSRAEDFRARVGGIPVYATAESGALTVRFSETGFEIIPCHARKKGGT